jgi:hypothetical protein
MRKTEIFLSVAAAAIFHPVGATILCVKPGGGGGCTATISAALLAAQPGDTIRVAEGTYTEYVVINQTLTLEGGWDTAFTIRDPALHVTTIQPPDATFSVVGIEGNIADSSLVAPTLDGFTITGGGGGNHGGGLQIRDSNARVTRNVITGNLGFFYGGGVWVQRGAPRFEGNRIENNMGISGPLGGGVELESTQAVFFSNVISHNHVDSGGAAGGLAVQGGGPVTLVGNTFDGNDDAGVDTDSNLSLVDNVIANHALGVRLRSGVITESFNDFWQNTANSSGFTLDASDLLVDPLLTADDHLGAGSPAIDAGLRVFGPRIDVDWQPRIMAGTSGFFRVDIGADEVTGKAQRIVDVDSGEADLTVIGPGGDPLSSTDGNQDNIGESVLALDVTGDGKADLVAAAMEWAVDPDNPPRTAGRLFGLGNFGSRVTGVIDLLNTAPDFTVQCTMNVQHMGGSLAGADVSGDGKSDLLIGSFSDDGAGGGLVFPTVFVLNAPLPVTRIIGSTTPADFTLQAPGEDFFAFSLKNALGAGDLDGDGIADVVVGDSLASDLTTAGTGAVFIQKGGPGLTGFHDLAVTPADFTIYGQAAADGLGPFAIGRIDAGSQLDIIARTNTTAYVFFGPLTGPTGTTRTTASADVTITGLAAAFDSRGSVIVGDFTGDGQDDVILASGNDLYVIPGPLTAGTIDASSAATLVLTGARAAALAFGDVIGDSRPDLIVGTTANPRGTFVVSGGTAATGSHPIDELADLVVEGPTSGFQYYDVSTGDLDLDGRADLVISAYPVTVGSHPVNFDDDGAAFVLYSPTLPAAGQTLKFFTVAPCRLIDTRRPSGTWGGPALSGGATRDFPVDTRCGIPPDATAVSANLTAVIPTGPGDLRIFPTGTPVPSASVINFGPGRTRANNTIVPLTGNPLGSMTVQCDIAGGSTNFLFDVNGYFKYSP